MAVYGRIQGVKELFQSLVLACTLLVVNTAYSRNNDGDLRLALELKDGSRLVGAPSIEKIPLQTPYARLSLALPLITAVEFTGDSGAAKVYLENGDILQGQVDLEAITIQTLFGRQTIPTQYITRIIMLAGNLLDGLILHYSFDNFTGGKILDLSSRENHGTVKGYIPRPQRILDNIYEFDGVDDHIECDNNLTSANPDSTITICVWIKPTVWGNRKSNCIVSKKANDNANGYVLYNDGYYPSKLNFRMRGTLGSANMLHSKSNVEIGVLQHWAVAYDPNAKQARIHKNGILDRTYEAITIGNMNNEIPLHIGRSHTWGGYFSGIMNDLMIFERTLTTEEIRQIYTSQRRD